MRYDIKVFLLKLKRILIPKLVHVLQFGGYSELKTVTGVNLHGNTGLS